MKCDECSETRTIHLTSEATSCGEASLGIQHQPHRADNIEKNDECTRIASFVCGRQFQNIFDTSYKISSRWAELNTMLMPYRTLVEASLLSLEHYRMVLLLVMVLAVNVYFDGSNASWWRMTTHF
jgi:hypothetical protein